MNKSVGGLGIEPMWNCVTCNHNQIHDNERDMTALSVTALAYAHAPAS